MKVNVSGRHVTVRPEWEDYANEKAERLGKYFSGIQHVDFVVDANAKAHRCEMTVVLGQGARLLGKAEAEEMRVAIDQAETKIEKQMRRFHAKLKAHRDRTRIADDVPQKEDSNEETYEQVIQEMLEEDAG